MGTVNGAKARCATCGKELFRSRRCSKCGGYFCQSHRSPSKHDCPSVTTKSPRALPVGKVLAVALLIVLVAGIALLLPKLATPEELKWLYDEGVFGAFIRGGKPEDRLSAEVDQIQDVGMNTLIYMMGLHDREKAADELRMLTRVLEREGIHVLIFIHLYHSGEPYRKAVQADGVPSNIFCPIDEDYWTEVVEEEILFLADRTNGYDLDGIALDLEQYGGQPDGQSASYGNNTCFCDYCMATFGRSRGLGDISKEVSPAERVDWLHDRGLLPEFYQYLQDRTVEMYRRTVRRAQKLNPNFIFSILTWTNGNWHWDGLPRGFGTSNAPLLIFDETTYYTGAFTTTPEAVKAGFERPESFSAFQRRYLKSLPGNALYVPGYYICQYLDYDFAEHIYNEAKDAAGYWLYYLDCLLEPNSVPEGERGHAPSESYYRELRDVRDELEKGDQGSMPMPGTDFHIMDIFALKAEAAALRRAQAATPEGSAEIGLSGPAAIFLHGSSPRIEVANSDGSFRALLIDNSTMLKQRAIFAPGEIGLITAQLEEEQQMVLRINCTGEYVLKLEGCLAGARLPLMLSSPGMSGAPARTHFRIPENSSTLTLVSLSAEGSVKVDVNSSEKGWTYSLVGRDQVEIPIPPNDWGTIWTLDLASLAGRPEITMWAGTTTPKLSLFPNLLE